VTPGDRTAESTAPTAADQAADHVTDQTVATQPAPAPLLEPRGGVPSVVEDPAALADVVAAMAAADGPVAVDAERASGYRYGQRAYLVQLRRGSAGTALIDPIALPDLSELSRAIADAEWVLHAANQDLPCLAGVGMVPTRLFDTELAARLAGYERVGLATMAELVLGQQLAKEHSAADWSRRPLPEPWLRYAALDVEILVDLRNSLERELALQGKLGWAREEFQAILDASPPAPRTDPWRRTSGMHRVRNRRQLAVVRALWEARDAEARRRDLAPGRVLPDASIVNAALALPDSAAALGRVSGWSGRATRRLVPVLWPALEAALGLPDADLPPSSLPSDGPPPHNRWHDRDPAAAARLAVAREVVGQVADAHGLRAENLLAPDTIRRLAWTPPEPLAPDTVAAALRGHGARAWQVELTAAALADALAGAPGATPTG
jgi:ribonuclease D